MDARERLRRYLEQRRELGETELLLDSLSVDDALRILGAGAASQAATPKQPSPRAIPADSERAIERTVADSASNPAADVAVDWRSALRASGAAPEKSREQVRETPRAPEPLLDPTPEPPDPPPKAKAGSPEGNDESTIAPTGLIVGGSVSRELFGHTSHLDTLARVEGAIAGCTRCPLYATATNPVPGEGNAQAELVVVGEAPGAVEDQEGRPFVGPAGQLLTKILGAIDLRREDVFICNVLKHRPPGNRNPLPDEIVACSPFLIRQIELIRPKALLALGSFAAQTLLETKLSISRLRGQIHRYHGVPLIVTYHPAALLRNPSWKRPTWEDVQLARRVLDRARAGA